jgi:hypothetical protein
MKKIIGLVLSLSILIYGCAPTAGLSTTPSQMQAQEQQVQSDFIAGAIVFVVVVCVVGVWAVTTGKTRRAKVKAELQACVGRTKAEIYIKYGPPDSIVDDAQGQGGTILIYQTITTSGGGRSGVSTSTYRRLFYIDKDNIVTAVKEDVK